MDSCGGGEEDEEVKAVAVYLFTIDMLDLPVSAVAQLTSFNRLLSSVNRKGDVRYLTVDLASNCSVPRHL